jgi:hypothetical protein
MQEDEIINRVATSGLTTFDLEQLYQPGARVLIDIKDQLYEGLVLREKEFRAFIKAHDWSQYKNSFVAIHCSSDAIVPTWAFMLLAIALQPFAKKVVSGDLEDLEKVLYQESLEKVNWADFRDVRVVVKGCSKLPVPLSAYVEVIGRLYPVVTSIMFGEPCSTVPLFKKAKN